MDWSNGKSSISTKQEKSSSSHTLVLSGWDDKGTSGVASIAKSSVDISKAWVMTGAADMMREAQEVIQQSGGSAGREGGHHRLITAEAGSKGPRRHVCAIVKLTRDRLRRQQAKKGVWFA